MSFTASFESTSDCASKDEDATLGDTVVCTLSTAPIMRSPKLGLLVDDGALFCAIGIVELHVLQKFLFNGKISIERNPQELSEFDYWQ